MVTFAPTTMPIGSCSRDPIDETSVPNFVSIHLYRYVDCKPLLALDPTGLWPWFPPTRPWGPAFPPQPENAPSPCSWCGRPIGCSALCGAVVCAMGYFYKDLAEKRARELARGLDADALQHCLWSCYLASSGMGPDSAKCVTDANERCKWNNYKPNEWCMDFYNNGKGREVAGGVPAISCDEGCSRLQKSGKLQTKEECPQGAGVRH
jgi:hypothetical protein